MVLTSRLFKFSTCLTLLCLGQAMYLTKAQALGITLESFAGEYSGNVRHSPLGKLAKVIKSGHLNVKNLGSVTRITVWSLLNKELSLDFKNNELAPYFSEKKERQMLSNGVLEERVSFRHDINEDYQCLDSCLGGLSANCHLYQLKFHDGKLTSFRVQQYSSLNPKKLLYLLEVADINKDASPPPAAKAVKKEQPEERKTDWDF